MVALAVAALVRAALLAGVWFVIFVVGNWAQIGIYASFPSGEPGNVPMLFMIGVMFLAGLALSERVLRLHVSFGGKTATPAPRKTAVETETLRLRDMLSLLDEDDLDDLRAEVREGLRDRIRNLTADETESFDDLLASAGVKPKRGGR